MKKSEMNQIECSKCKIELVPQQWCERIHMIPELRFPLEMQRQLICPKCGDESRYNQAFISTDGRVASTALEKGQFKDHQAFDGHRMVWIHGIDGDTASSSLAYEAVSDSIGTALYPVCEGTLHDGGHPKDIGDPDRMAVVAGEYLKAYRTIVPKDGLPKSVSEMMPAVHVLVVAAELALKAYLIRSEKESPRRLKGHSLGHLYRLLEDSHRLEIEKRFHAAPLNFNLRRLGINPQPVESLLQRYDGESAYTATKYLGETTLKKNRKLPASIVFPNFLPDTVQIMLEVYYFCSGVERLRRLGAIVDAVVREPSGHYHGYWNFVPASVGLTVIRASAQTIRDERGKPSRTFDRFKETHPPGYCTSWKQGGYGGGVLLFYRSDSVTPPGGEVEIDGLGYEIVHTSGIEIHSRDLYLLANALEKPEGMSVYPFSG